MKCILYRAFNEERKVAIDSAYGTTRRLPEWVCTDGIKLFEAI